MAGNETSIASQPNPPAPHSVKVAVVQAGSILFDTPRSLEKLADLTADATKQQAELVVFTEVFIGG
jgi:nitrilase